MKFTLEDLHLKIKLITLYILLSINYDFSSITGSGKVFKHKHFSRNSIGNMFCGCGAGMGLLSALFKASYISKKTNRLKNSSRSRVIQCLFTSDVVSCLFV